MSDVSKLYKILRKSKVSFAELQFVINDEHVKSVDVTKSDNVFYTKYDSNFYIFNDTFRDAIRGNNDPSKGYINGNQYNSTINNLS